MLWSFGREELEDIASKKKGVKVIVLSPLDKTHNHTTISNGVLHPASFPVTKRFTQSAMNGM